MSDNLLRFRENDIIPFSFWRLEYGESYAYVKAYDVKKEGFLPEGISSHFRIYVEEVVESEKIGAIIEEFDTRLLIYNKDFYDFVEATAPVYELLENRQFVLINEEYTGKVPTTTTVREASKLYNNVIKPKIHDMIQRQKMEAFDVNFKEASLDGKSAVMYGFSAQALVEIDSSKYHVSFIEKDELGDFTILVTRKEN